MYKKCIHCNNKIEEKDGMFFCNNCNKKLSEDETVNIINVNEDAKNGQLKCTKCGSTEIYFDEKLGSLKCNYCGNKYKGEAEDSNKIKGLVGITKGKWADDIGNNNSDIIVVKCNSCGAEVVINTKDSGIARCQWCRNLLVANDVQNGTVPDKILPFKITKEEAFKKINEYIEKDGKKSLTTTQFKNEIKLENITGAYMSYMMVDANVHAKLTGIGNHITNITKKENYRIYNFDEYNIEREFDLYVDDLIIESNAERQDLNSIDRANNILNSIMPFDTENCLKFTANYLVGYSSEQRNLNFSDLEKKAIQQLTDIAKTPIKNDSNYYDMGIKINSENIDINGSKWYSVYLPVWILSFKEEKNGKTFIHYIAVNGRTGKTMGSMPTNNTYIPTIIITLISSILLILLPIIYVTLTIWKQLLNSPTGRVSGTITLHGLNILPGAILGLLFLSGILMLIRFATKKNMRNKEARYNFETLTRKSVVNIVKKDEKINSKTKRII